MRISAVITAGGSGQRFGAKKQYLELAGIPILRRTVEIFDRHPLIDAIVESCNAFMRKLKADGAIIDGKVWFDPADNETTELAAGHVTFTYDFMPPTPAERVTYKSIVNIDYLNQLGTKSS